MLPAVIDGPLFEMRDLAGDTFAECDTVARQQSPFLWPVVLETDGPQTTVATIGNGQRRGCVR